MTRWSTAFVVLSFVGVAVYLTLFQSKFLDEFKSTINSDVGYLMLCEIHSERCQVIDGSKSSKLSAAIKHLSGAMAKLPPSKAERMSERILRIGKGSLTAKQYVGCYRVIQYVGSEDLYINQITSDPECTRIEKYMPSYVAVPAQGLTNLFTTKDP